MAERVTQDDLAQVQGNLNRRLKGRGSRSRVAIEFRNGHAAADEWNVADGHTLRTLVVGTKREVYDALWHMIRAIDLLP